MSISFIPLLNTRGRSWGLLFRHHLCVEDCVLETRQSWPKEGQICNHFSYWKISVQCHLFFHSSFYLSHCFLIYPPAACIVGSVIADSVMPVDMYMDGGSDGCMTFNSFYAEYAFTLHHRLFKWSLSGSLGSLMLLIMLSDNAKNLLGLFLFR